MTETTSIATNPRPAMYRIIKGTPKGLVGTLISSNAKTITIQPLTGDAPLVKRLDSAERIFRTPEEKERGEDFTPAEAAAWEADRRSQINAYIAEGAATTIDTTIAQIAERLERAAAETRNTLTLPHTTPAERVTTVQHTVNWLSANLGAHDLTREAIRWAVANERLQDEG